MGPSPTWRSESGPPPSPSFEKDMGYERCSTEGNEAAREERQLTDYRWTIKEQVEEDSTDELWIHLPFDEDRW